MKKMNKKGFTLVEIMIVVAIIGLLAAIGIPSFQKARQSSMQKMAINNTRIVNAAIDQYAIENGLTDGAEVTTDLYLPYIKDGTDGLKIGSTTAELDAGEVGNATKLTAQVLYPGLFEGEDEDEGEG
mgnify:CR=1 FL=1